MPGYSESSWIKFSDIPVEGLEPYVIRRRLFTAPVGPSRMLLRLNQEYSEYFEYMFGAYTGTHEFSDLD